MLTAAKRTSDAPAFSIQVTYDGDAAPTTIAVPGRPRRAALRRADRRGPTVQGRRYACRAPVPCRLGYLCRCSTSRSATHERIVPIIDSFSAFLRGKGHAGAALKVGEDVCQLDMVACASPHWGPDWLGGARRSGQSSVNCVSKNGWAVKQLIQTKPAVLLLIGEASYTMFTDAFGPYISAAKPLPKGPSDGAFTLLRLSTDAAVNFRFNTQVDGVAYGISIRIVVAPHFSYSENFIPQYRFSPSGWAAFQASFPDCAAFLQHDPAVRPAQA